MQQIRSKADVNSTSVIKWDLETSFDSFTKCFLCPSIEESYRSCVVMNLDRCHSQMISESISSASASDTSCICICIFMIRIRICICILIRFFMMIINFIFGGTSMSTFGGTSMSSMISVNTQCMCIFIFGDLFLIPIVQSKRILSEVCIERHSADPTPSIKYKNGGFFYAVAQVIARLNLENTHTFVHYGTCPLTCVHKKVWGGLCYTLPIEVPDLPIDHLRSNLFDYSSFISECDKQFQEKCVELSHYEIHLEMQQDEMSPKFQWLSFHLWGSFPCLIDSLSNSACKLLWHQRLIHCGEHTLGYKNKFNDLTHCETCLKATLTNSPAGHHSLRDWLANLYQGLCFVFGFPGRILKDKDKKIMESPCLDIELLNKQQA